MCIIIPEPSAGKERERVKFGLTKIWLEPEKHEENLALP
jgi:hypothetical protein